MWEAALISAGVWTVVLALWLDVRFMCEALERISTDSMAIHGDFDTFWRSAAALWEGRDVYDTGARLTNLNPPFWILLVSPLVLATLSLGQIYPVLALGLVAAWVADRRGRPSISGGALGLVVAIKPSLAPVLLWLLVRRRWRAFGVSLASGVAA